MKKIIVGILSLAFLLVGSQSVFASSVWNGDSRDCPSINIANGETQEGYGDPCWNLTNINVKPGDTINVKIYYHNTNTVTNNNTVIKLNTPTGSSTSHSFSGSISSSQGSISTGSVRANISSSQTLTFGSAYWYPDRSWTPVPLISGQNGSEILSSGLSIGNIAPGFSTQGAVVVSFKVGNAVIPTPPVVCTDRNASNYGQVGDCKPYETFSIKVIKNEGGTITSNSGKDVYNYNESDYYSVIPSYGYTLTKVLIDNVSVGQVPSHWYYPTFTLINKDHTIEAIFTKNVVAKACTVSLSTDTPKIAKGETGNLKWTLSDGCTGATITPSVTEYTTISKSISVYPVDTTTYKITANGLNGGVVSDSVTITVTQPSTPTKCTDGNASNYGQVGNCIPYGEYKVTLTVIGSGKIIPSRTSTAIYKYPNNSDFFNFVPSTGYHVESASIDGKSISTLYGYNLSNITQNYEIKVTFVANSVTSACSITEFRATPSTITSGSSSNLIWSTTGCSSINISNLGDKLPSVSTGQSVYPTNTTTYVLTATGANGASVNRQVTITVNKPVARTYTITATASENGSISRSGVTTVAENGSKYYSFSAKSGYHIADVRIDGSSIGATNGSYFFDNVVSNHTIVVNFVADQVSSRSCITTFTASDYSITRGGHSTLIWTLTDCTSASILPTVETVTSSNSQVVFPASTTAYTLTAIGTNGVISKTITITVSEPIVPNQPGAGIVDYTINSNNNNSINNSNNVTKYITITKGSDSNTYTRCMETRAINYYEYGTCVYYNNPQTRCLDTFANNYLSYSYCTYSTQIRCLEPSASNYLSYASCTYNQIRCLEPSASNYLAYNSCVYNTYVNKNVVTTVATNIFQNQAQLNGYITNTNYYNSNVYFNYGTTINMGNRTNPKPTNGNSYFSDYVSGLTPNTIYFFQAVGENSGGISKGNIEVFKTLGDGTVRPIVIQGNTIVGTDSPIVLTITNRYQLIGEGDLVDYVVTYKNIGKTKLTKPLIQVVIPTNMTLVNASRGTYGVDEHTLSASVEDLASGQEGVIYLQANVNTVEANNAQIVTTAILVYTNSNNAQENAIAYVFNVPKGMASSTTSGLGANAFFSGLISLGLVGWLLILLLILIIILIAKSYSRNNTSSTSNTVTHTTTH